MLPFCANLVVSSAAPAPFILYEDAKARRQIMKEFASDQRVARSDQLQEQRDFAYRQQDQALLAHLNEIEESQAQLQREIDEDAFHALLQREFDELFAKLQEQAQAPSAVLSSHAPSDEDDFSHPEKYFGSKQRAQRKSRKSKEDTHLEEQIAFAEERSGNAQDAEQEPEEYRFGLEYRNSRLRRKAERKQERQRKQNDRAKQAMLFGEGGWYEETEKAETETTQFDTAEVDTTPTANSSESYEASEPSNDVARPSRRATPADLGVQETSRIHAPRLLPVPNMGGRSFRNDLRANRRT